MFKKIILFLFLLASTSQAATVTIPNTYQTGGSVTATNLNANFSALATPINGGLDNTNANTTGGYRFFEVKSSLPGTGSQGRVVFDTSTNSLNFDNGSAWIGAVAPSGTLATGVIPYYSSGWVLLSPGAQYYSLVSNGGTSLPSFQQVNMANGVTSTLAIGNGGTGQTTAQAAIDVLLPSQTSNSGKFITTNGTTSSWGSPTIPTVKNVIGGSTDSPLASSTKYFSISGGTGLSTDVSGMIFPIAGTLRNFYVSSDTNSGSNFILVVNVNGSPSNITTGTVSSPTLTASDTTHTASISAGDRVSINLNTGSGTARNIRWGIEFDPS